MGGWSHALANTAAAAISLVQGSLGAADQVRAQIVGDEVVLYTGCTKSRLSVITWCSGYAPQREGSAVN